MNAAEDLDIETARVFLPLLEPARYKGAYGGRGSGKSHFFAEMIVEQCIYRPGLRVVCIREVQKTLKQSAKKLIEDKIIALGVGHLFTVLEAEIKTPGNGLIIFQGMQDHTADSIKSLEGFDVAWVEEAQSLSETSLKLLRPTIRKEGSELWFSWNPRFKTDPVDVLLRENTPSNAVVVEANWDSNPWFPEVLEQERQDCYNNEPDDYEHVWEGDYVTAIKGAYYKDALAVARREGRIGRVAQDPLLSVRLFCDIGGTGRFSDAFAIWAVQFIGKEIRILNYYEAQGQPIGAHLAWMREEDYTPANAKIWLPHDGVTGDRVFDVSYESEFRRVGYDVTTVPNQGKGAASMRVSAARNLFNRMWFDEKRCDSGIKALGWYHERWDEERNCGLGPEHDWSSHGCFVAGTMIDTARGEVPIENVAAGDKVWTPVGWVGVEWSGEVKKASELIEAILDNGARLVMTGEHKIFTTRGLVSADALRYNDAVITTRSMPCLRLESANRTGYRAAFTESFAEISSGTGRSEGFTFLRKAANSAFCTAKRSVMVLAKSCRGMATGMISAQETGSFAQETQGGIFQANIHGRSLVGSNSIEIRTVDIIPGVILLRSICIRLSGFTTTAKSPKDSMSTTSMVTRVTTGLKTLSCCLPVSTQRTMRQLIHGWVRRKTKSILEKPERKQKPGIAARKASDGIRSTERKRGLIERFTQKTVPSAEKSTQHTGRNDPNIAAQVVSVRRISSPETPVYDLTVPHHHCYYANGVLVSNSDALGLMAISYEEPVSNQDHQAFRRNRPAGNWRTI